MSSLRRTSPEAEARDAGPIDASALCLTGGGILGRYTLEILLLLAEMRRNTLGNDRPDSHLRFAFDLIAGTSVGALLAGGIAAGVEPRHIVSVMHEYGAKIFPEKSELSRLSHLNTAWFSNDSLEAAVNAALADYHDITLGDLDTNIAIPALNETKGIPIVYSSLNADHKSLKLSDVVLASAAAPIYLPAWKIDQDRFVDGGLFANAPDLIAVRIMQECARNLKMENISIISVGTTDADRASPVNLNEDGDWGLKRWFMSPVPARLVKAILSAQTTHLVSIAKSLPLDHYERIDTVLDGTDSDTLSMDNASDTALKRLEALAQKEFHSMPETRRDTVRILVSRATDTGRPEFSNLVQD